MCLDNQIIWRELCLHSTNACNKPRRRTDNMLDNDFKQLSHRWGSACYAGRTLQKSTRRAPWLLGTEQKTGKVQKYLTLKITFGDKVSDRLLTVDSRTLDSLLQTREPFNVGKCRHSWPVGLPTDEVVIIVFEDVAGITSGAKFWRKRVPETDIGIQHFNARPFITRSENRRSHRIHLQPQPNIWWPTLIWA